MRQDAWVVVLGRGWSPDVSGRVEAACVLTHVEPAMRQDAWVVVLGRGWSPDVSGRVEAACVLTHVEPAMRQDAWERKRERGGGVSSQAKKMCVVTFQDNFTKLCPHNSLFIIQVIPDMIAGVPEKCEPSQVHLTAHTPIEGSIPCASQPTDSASHTGRICLCRSVPPWPGQLNDRCRTRVGHSGPAGAMFNSHQIRARLKVSCPCR